MLWIEEIDKELYELACKENMVYYLQDIGKRFDGKRLQKIAGERMKILTSPGLANGMRVAQKCKNKALKRKAQLLEKAIIRAKIEYDPILNEIKNEITAKQHQFDFSSVWKTLSGCGSRESRRNAYLSQIPRLKSVEKSFKNFIVRANSLSRAMGFSGYIEARFYAEETCSGQVAGFMDCALEKTEQAWKEFIQDSQNRMRNGVKPYDLDYLINEKKGIFKTSRFGRKEIINALKDTVSSFGIAYYSLPISIENYSLPYAGACYPLEVGKDIRLIISNSQGYAYCKTLFHEFGHAIYYAFAPSGTELWIDNQLMRETMADIWKGIAETGEWLERFSPFSAAQIAKLRDLYEQSEALWLRPLVRDYLFEAEIFKNEAPDFSSTWERITKNALFFSDSTGFYSDWGFPTPLDIKNYVISTLVKERCISFLKKRFPPLIGEADFLNLLIRKLYQPGNTVHFKKKLGYIGWKPL